MKQVDKIAVLVFSPMFNIQIQSNIVTSETGEGLFYDCDQLYKTVVLIVLKDQHKNGENHDRRKSFTGKIQSLSEQKIASEVRESVHICPTYQT